MEPASLNRFLPSIPYTEISDEDDGIILAPQQPVQAQLSRFGSIIRFMRFFGQSDGQPQVAESHVRDTLSGLSPFFWLLRILGLCPRIAIFDNNPTVSRSKNKWWDFILTAYCVSMGSFLWLGFIATFGFSMVWPVMFCAGFHSIMGINATKPCKEDLLQRFLTPKGLNALIQSGFLFIGAVNVVVSGIACSKMGPIVVILRKYYQLTKSMRVKSHRIQAIFHAVISLVVSLAIGVPFIIVYEQMLLELENDPDYISYPFPNIDTPIEKIEDWIAYASRNMSRTSADKFVLSWLKIVFRAENVFAVLSCFVVPFFFSLMCSTMTAEWKRFIKYLQEETTKNNLSMEVLRNIRHSHWMLCKLFWFLDDCFTRMIFVIYVLFIIMNSCIIYIVLKFGMFATGRDQFAFYQAILMFVSLEIIFSLVIRQAMKAHLVTQEVNEEIRDWQPHLETGMDVEYLLLVNQVSKDMVFTAWNSFDINGAAYIKAVAVIFSYVLLMLQYVPSTIICQN